MQYEYDCKRCLKRIEITKRVEFYNLDEKCPDCATVLTKVFSKTQLYNTAVQEAYWSPAHGHVVKGRTHEEKLAKQKGWEPIGNERPEKHLRVRRTEYE